MKPFHLEILTPERAFYVGECLSLIVPVADGMLGIMADHTPLTAAVPDGEVMYLRPDGERVICAVSPGMVDVSAQGVQLLCDSVLLPEEIDEEGERRRAEEALLRLREKQGHRDYVLSQRTFARAVNNLRVKQHNARRMNHL
ncbi:MAG: F0F1 ATP synthase subunit epsilon [Eubacteriales bacterium]